MWWINDWHQWCMWCIWCDWQLAPMLCADCGKNFCVSHRLLEVHACTRDVLKTKPATPSPFPVVADSPPQPLPSYSKPVTPWPRASQLQPQQPKGQVTLTLSLTLDFITQNTSSFLTVRRAMNLNHWLLTTSGALNWTRNAILRIKIGYILTPSNYYSICIF